MDHGVASDDQGPPADKAGDCSKTGRCPVRVNRRGERPKFYPTQHPMCHLKLFLAGCQEEFFRPYAAYKLRVRTLRQETPKIYFQKSVKSAFDRDHR